MLVTQYGATCNIGVHPHTSHDLQEEAGICYSICKHMGESWLLSMQHSGKSDFHQFFYTMVLPVLLFSSLGLGNEFQSDSNALM